MMWIDFIWLLLKTAFGLLSKAFRGSGCRRPWRVNAVRLFSRHLLHSSLRKGVPWLRSRQLAFSRIFTHPSEVTFAEANANGVPGLWCLPNKLSATSRWIVYLHGGGYVTGSPDSYRDVLSQIAVAADAAVLGVEYRLAPEATFPAAHQDALAATQYVIGQAGSASRVALAGDSAGGTLCVATLLALREGGFPLPAACAVMSPWVDPNATGGSMASQAGNDILSPELLASWRDAYLSESERNDPRVNLLGAPLFDLPPILIQVGDAEVFYDQIIEFVTRLKEAGVDVTLVEFEKMFHVFQCFRNLLPEGRDALRQLGEFLRKRLAATNPPENP